MSSSVTRSPKHEATGGAILSRSVLEQESDWTYARHTRVAAEVAADDNEEAHEGAENEA